MRTLPPTAIRCHNSQTYFYLDPTPLLEALAISVRVVIELDSPAKGIASAPPKNSFVKAFAVQWTKIGLSKTREDMRCIEIGGSEYLNERVLRPFCSSPCRALMFRYGC